MRLITNLGANLTPAQIDHYRVVITSQQITADGVRYATNENLTREHMTIEFVDKLLRESKEWPHVLGTSSAEFASLFKELSAVESEIVVVTNSRKIIGSYDAASAAARALSVLKTAQRTQVTMVDSCLADSACGYLTAFMGESVAAGHSVSAAADAARKIAAAGQMILIPTAMEHLVKSGRATFLKSMAATLLQRLPVIGFREGELCSVGTVPRSAPLAASVAKAMAAEVAPGTAAAVCISHGHQEAAAHELAEIMRKQYAVHTMLIRTLSSGVYTNVGESLAASVLPVDAAPWRVKIFEGE